MTLSTVHSTWYLTLCAKHARDDAKLKFRDDAPRQIPTSIHATTSSVLHIARLIPFRNGDIHGGRKGAHVLAKVKLSLVPLVEEAETELTNG